jgi:periplasmic divalent cation tolerance protein
MAKYFFIYITTKDKKEACKIGKVLVRERLAACVNIIPNMNSFYWWEGKLQDDRECVLIAKTKSSLVKKLIAKVKKVHSYTCPCVICLPVVEANPTYLNWIDKETK